MTMKNLLEEAIEVLRYHGKTLGDILFVYTDEGCFVPTNGCKTFLDVDYDEDWSSQDVIRGDLKLVGKDFWLERYSNRDSYGYGYETWEFKQQPRFNRNANKKISVYADPEYTKYFW